MLEAMVRVVQSMVLRLYLTLYIRQAWNGRTFDRLHACYAEVAEGECLYHNAVSTRSSLETRVSESTDDALSVTTQCPHSRTHASLLSTGCRLESLC